MKPIYYVLFAILAVPLLTVAILNHDSPWVTYVGTIELILVTLIVTAFVLIYFGKNWHANVYGRALMYSKGSFALLLIFVFVSRLLGPDWTWRPLISLFLFTGFLLSQTRLLYLVIVTKRDSARERNVEGEELNADSNTYSNGP